MSTPAQQLAFEGWLSEEDRDIDSDDEYTPDELCELIRDFFGGDIDLDPCAAPSSFVNARVQYFKGDDGLSLSWTATQSEPSSDAFSYKIRTRYVNPPYSRPGPWLKKIVETHSQIDRANPRPYPADAGDTIALVKCDPSTKAWAWAWQADAILFFARRIPFANPNRTTRSPAKFPCALLYWGDHAEAFRDWFDELGHVVLRTAEERIVEQIAASTECAGGFAPGIYLKGEIKL